MSNEGKPGYELWVGTDRSHVDVFPLSDSLPFDWQWHYGKRSLKPTAFRMLRRGRLFVGARGELDEPSAVSVPDNASYDNCRMAFSLMDEMFLDVRYAVNNTEPMHVPLPYEKREFVRPATSILYDIPGDENTPHLPVLMYMANSGPAENCSLSCVFSSHSLHEERLPPVFACVVIQNKEQLMDLAQEAKGLVPLLELVYRLRWT